MKDLLVIAIGAGLHDGLNPCLLMSSAVFIAYGFLFPSKSYKINFLRFLFLLVYGLSFLIFNFGPAPGFVFQKNFINLSKVLYFLLGVGSFGLGVLSFKEWFDLSRGKLVQKSVEETSSVPLLKFCGAYGGGVILACVLSALSTFWPMNVYLMILGNEALLKGQWSTILPLLLVYSFVSLWLLWLVWAFLSLKKIRLSLYKIICASIFFTASSVVFFIFK